MMQRVVMREQRAHPTCFVTETHRVTVTVIIGEARRRSAACTVVTLRFPFRKELRLCHLLRDWNAVDELIPRSSQILLKNVPKTVSNKETPGVLPQPGAPLLAVYFLQVFGEFSPIHVGHTVGVVVSELGNLPPGGGDVFQFVLN